jgi:hypothetical protein
MGLGAGFFFAVFLGGDFFAIVAILASSDNYLQAALTNSVSKRYSSITPQHGKERMADTNLQVVDRQAPLVRQSFEPASLQEAIEFASKIADSDLLPKDFKGKPANILVALQIGKELNIPPLQALQGIYVVNGRGVVWGDLMWAIITSHRDFEDAVEEVNDTQAKVTLKRRGRSPVTVIFTQADAIKAGLWQKQGPWTQYPKRQMLWRARTFAARDLFPDALKGLTSAEEASDFQVIEGTTSPSTAEPTAEQKPAAELTIGQTGGSEFYKKYKTSGWTPEEAKSYLSATFQIGPPHNEKNSKDIPISKKKEAFEWADTKAPIRIAAEEKFETLGLTPDERLKFFQELKGVWAEVDKALTAEIEKRNAAERGE